MKRLLTILTLILFAAHLKGQAFVHTEETPRVAIKSNILSDLSTSLSLGVEIKIKSRMSLDLPVQYNPWSFGNNKKIRHFLFQPSLRYWLCETFNRHFVGVHLHGGLYNVGGIGFSDYMKEHRFEGWGMGGGISYGYHWLLSSRFSLEAGIGLGYVYLDYDVFRCESCSPKEKESNRHYVGPTQLNLSLIYHLK